MKYCTGLEQIAAGIGSFPRNLIGGKAYNLARVYNCGLPVPKSIVVTSKAMDRIFSEAGIAKRLKHLGKASGASAIIRLSEELKRSIMDAAIPNEISDDIRLSLEELGTKGLAVRSSSSSEDSPDRSHAGLYDSYLCVQRDEAIEAVKACWASLFNVTAIYYMAKLGGAHDQRMSVIIQEMIDAEYSGVAFTSFPDKDDLTIEAVEGLGCTLVSGEVEPDRFTVDNRTYALKDKKLGKRNVKAVAAREGVKCVELGRRKGRKALEEDVIKEIAEKARHLEAQFGCPQDVEWSVTKAGIVILQSRDQAHLKTRRVVFSSYLSALDEPVIKGRVYKPSDGAMHDETSNEKYILVIPSASPIYLPYLLQSKAVVSEEGGILTHLAIVCRELDIPYIAITNAMSEFDNDEEIELSIDLDSNGIERRPVEEWVPVCRYLGTLPDEDKIKRDRELIKQLPQLIGKDYELEVRHIGNALNVSGKSYEKYLFDLGEGVDMLAESLGAYEAMSADQRRTLVLLTMLAVQDCLFPMLLELTKDKSHALSLIKYGGARYLELENKRYDTLITRYGVEDGVAPTPRDLKDRFLKMRRKRGGPDKSLLGQLSEPERIQKLSEIICTLLRAYEDKDRI